MSSHTLSCDSDFPVSGFQEGEGSFTVVRILSTFCAASVISAWFSWTRIKRLSFFFAHWLSGLVMGLCLVAEDMMVTVCWTSSGVTNLIKALKLLEIASSNMLAITNLAICVNLALIIVSHRSVTRVRSISSPGLFIFLVLVSIGLAASTIPFCEDLVVLGTMFWCYNTDEEKSRYMSTSVFFVELVVGLTMSGIVVWQLLFRLEEIKECWSIHVRIRYYFGLTLLGALVNLALGIGGTIFIYFEDVDSRLLGWSWMLRYVHIALDTVVLYGVLGEQSLAQHVDPSQSSESMSSDLVKS